LQLQPASGLHEQAVSSQPAAATATVAIAARRVTTASGTASGTATAFAPAA